LKNLFLALILILTFRRIPSRSLHRR
jgi:hypothetical protein